MKKMLKLLNEKYVKFMQRGIEARYNKLGGKNDQERYENAAFLFFLDSLLSVFYFLFFVFAVISFYFFLTYEIIPYFRGT